MSISLGSTPARPGPFARHIPATSWPPIGNLARACDNFLGHEMTTFAAALAYRGLLALFPFVIFVIAIVNAIDVWRFFDLLADWARTGPQGRVPAAIKEWAVLQARGRADGAVLSVGAVAAVWAVGSGARVLRRALNVVAEQPEVQSPWVRLAVSLVAAPVLGAAVLAAVSLFTVTRRVLLDLAGWFEVHRVVLAVWDWLRLPAGVILAAAIISAVYRYAPSHRQAFRAVLPGAVLAASVWAVASLIFSRAVAGLLQFGFTYGSFSAAIVILVYLYLAAAGLLFGAELNAVLASASDRDTATRERHR